MRVCGSDNQVVSSVFEQHNSENYVTLTLFFCGMSYTLCAEAHFRARERLSIGLHWTLLILTSLPAHKQDVPVFHQGQRLFDDENSSHFCLRLAPES